MSGSEQQEEEERRRTRAPWGVIALVLLTGGGRWVYPVATLILTGFIGFMSWHLAEQWSNWVLTFVLFDLFTLLLVLNEWRNEKTHHLRHRAPIHF